MNKITIIIILVIKTIIIQAQSIQRSVIGNAGKVITSGAYKLSYTVGESITKKVNASSLSINQGFQQNIIVSTALPITGLDFTAIRLNKTEVQLTWKTAQEINNKGFTIERQLDTEKEFYPIGFEASKAENGNSNSEINYSRVDKNPSNTTSYYRLKQEDIDGKFTYSLTRVVMGSDTKQTTFKAWPQPSNGELTIMTTGINQRDELMVMSMNGQIIQRHTIENNTPLNISILASGVYLLRLMNNNDMYLKIIIQ